MGNDYDLTLAICAYNSEKYIAYTLASIESQTYKNFEVLIINDGSTDNTLKIIEEFSKCSTYGPYKIISMGKNAGTAKVRSVALNVTSTKYMIFVDSDNVLYPDFVGKLVNKINSDDDLIAVGCYSEYIDHCGNLIKGGINLGAPSKDAFYKSARANELIYMDVSTIFNRETALLVGGFSTSGFPEGNIRYQDYCEDLDLWTRMSDLHIEGKAIIVIPEVLYQYRKTGYSVSSIKAAMVMRMNHIKLNLNNRRNGFPELSCIDFLNSLPNREKRAVELESKAASKFRDAVFAYHKKHYLKAAIGVALSFFSCPSIFRKRSKKFKKRVKNLVNILGNYLPEPVKLIIKPLLYRKVLTRKL